MDKAAIKTFAINSRRKLMEDVVYRMSLIGVSKDGIQDSITDAEGIQTFNIGGAPYSIYDEDIKKRENLIKEVENKGFENVVEEVAYTWFNRIIAIRYMEVNDYLPTRTRVLSSETPDKIEPDIIKEAFNLDLDYTDEDRKHIFKLKDENKLDELFRFLFIKQCNKLNEILPGLFEKTEDFMELLLNISFVSGDGVVRNLIDTIPEEDFTNQVEIIGWLYQFYIFEKKDEIINFNKGKILKKDIPAATQLFTTDWVVRYMVDNSLGKYWIERNPNTKLKNSLEYYFGETEQNDLVKINIGELSKQHIVPEEIKFFDPCMGSGHVLVYAFDLFIKIYKELGYIEKDIPKLILTHNLFGLDIDDRAYQLAYFAILMKARKYDKKIFKKNIVPNIFSIKESSKISDNIYGFIEKYDSTLLDDVKYLIETFKSGKEFGSLIQVKDLNFDNIRLKLVELIENQKTLTNIEFGNDIENFLIPILNQAEILSIKYDVVVTNPPYMNRFENSFKNFAKKYYKNYSKDLFSMFIYRNLMFCKKDGYAGFMTPFVWMFLSTYEKLRDFIIENKYISSLIQLEYSAFSEATVPICTFVLGNKNYSYNGTFLKLSEFTGGMDVQKEKVLEALSNNVDYKFYSNSEKFEKIPGHPISYWINENIADAFSKCKSLKDIAILKSGKSTSGLNDKLFKYWFEVDFNKIDFNANKLSEVDSDYVPLNKGGSYRHWYGNKEYVSLKEFAGNNEYDFSESITWSDINSSYFSARLHESGIISNNVGKRAYFNNFNDLLYILGYLNTNLTEYLLDLIIPTIHFDIGYVGKLPIIKENNGNLISLVKDCINLSKVDWDDYELSWDFAMHPFLKFKSNDLKIIFDSWKSYKLNQFNQLKNNEIEINKYFNQLYDVEEIISNDVPDNKISISLADYIVDVKSFVSYAVGCMFGRYSLDEENLVFAGGEFDLSRYSKFVPDDDNIIPVLDTEYFEDDIVGRFVEFVRTCFGNEKLEENLDFIGNALNKNKKTSREKIREYFLKNFSKDHSKIYKKCPIYWQFNSGKENGFNCLVYMHRYDSSLVARVRTKYLHETQKKIRENISLCDNIINNSNVASEKNMATKEKNKLIKQLAETIEYDEALSHIANKNIYLDFNQGIKINYDIFQAVEIPNEGKSNKKINLLKKL